MVQVVFVHGVATRGGPEYELSKRNRDKLIRASLFGPDAAIASPLWGDLMSQLTFDGASYRKQGEVAALSLAGGMAPTAVGAAAAETSVLSRVAATQPASAIDLLFAERIIMAEGEGIPLSDKDVKAFAAAVDLLDPQHPGDPSKLAQASDDAAFVETFDQITGRNASLAITDPLIDAAMSIADRVRNIVSKGAFDLVVEPMNPLVATFLGDVFRYLKDGELRTAIRAKVCADLAEAWGAKKAGEPLVLIGHSLGGVILYDMLSEPEASGLPAGFKADALVTVGSQPGLFQELGLFDHTPRPEKGQVVEGPTAASVWINTYDPIDPFGFASKPMFALPTDYSFDSVTGLLSAHTTYFIRPQFYARLRRRLADAGILH